MEMQTLCLLPTRPPVCPAGFPARMAPFYPPGTARRRVVSLWSRGARKAPENLEAQGFANIASRDTVQTLTSCSNPQILAPPPPSLIGSPLLWIGVGIGISAAFNTMATRLKRMAILKAFKEIMGPNSPQDGNFNTAAFAPGTPFPFPSATPSAATVPLDVPKTNVQAIPSNDISNKTKADEEKEGHDTGSCIVFKK